MKTLLLLLPFLLAAAGCAEKPKVHELVPEENPDGSVAYTVVLDELHQEIDNFGASDAWTIKYVGKNWPAAKREQIADLLFSVENDASGKPKGIGLSLWRTLFGAGSDTHSGMPFHEWNFSGCIRSSDGVYDMGDNGIFGGKFWFMKAAKARGVEQFLGFCNSPPYYWTYTGLTNSAGNNDYMYKLNLKDEHTKDYAAYIAEIVKRTKETHGVDFDYFCPLNEPEWQADGGESCHARNFEVAKVAKAVAAKFTEYGVGTKVVIPESGKPQFVYYYEPYLPVFESDKVKYGYKAKNFFSTSGADTDYVGDIPNIAKLLATHSYWSVDTDNELKQIRTKVGEEIRKYGIKYWQTEFCILSDDYDLGTNPDGTPVGGGGRDYSMALALYVARIIYADLVYADASAWHWWVAATAVDYKDGLIYLLGNQYDGEVADSKLLWAFGNFSRFIRPGAYRVGITSKYGDTDNLHGVMTSAYKNTDGSIVVVFINYTDEKKPVNINVDDGVKRTFMPYQTSDAADDDLRPRYEIESGEGFNIPARSVVTFKEILP
jgi:O-glycosyl hydrolase